MAVNSAMTRRRRKLLALAGAVAAAPTLLCACAHSVRASDGVDAALHLAGDSTMATKALEPALPETHVFDAQSANVPGRIGDHLTGG